MSRSFQIRFDFVSVCSSINGLAVGFSVSDLLVYGVCMYERARMELSTSLVIMHNEQVGVACTACTIRFIHIVYFR